MNLRHPLLGPPLKEILASEYLVDLVDLVQDLLCLGHDVVLVLGHVPAVAELLVEILGKHCGSLKDIMASGCFTTVICIH